MGHNQVFDPPKKSTIRENDLETEDLGQCLTFEPVSHISNTGNKPYQGTS